MGPKPNVLVSRRFTTACEGPVASLMGTILSPALGAESKVPSGVQYVVEGAVGVTTEGHVAVETSPGRSLKIESLLRSLVVVRLKGVPELAKMKGLKRKL